MSCTVMYQPYAMSYSSSSSNPSSCERTSENKKMFKLPVAPSPPDSLHSEHSSYHSPAPPLLPPSSHTISRRPPSPLPPTPETTSSHSPQYHPTYFPPQLLNINSLNNSSTHSSSINLSTHSSINSLNNSSINLSTHPLNNSSTHSSSTHSLNNSSTHSLNNSSINSLNNGSNSASINLSSHSSTNSSLAHLGGVGSSVGATNSSSTSSNSPGSSRVHYLSSNAVIYFNYDGDSAKVVDEHFDRTLYASEKNSSKSSPMLSRNFPPSFWNSNYQQGLGGGGGGKISSYSEFYESAYGPLHHPHHQTVADPWHYSLPPPPPHHNFHHPQSYPPPPPRFNHSQYGSFLLGASGSGRNFGPSAQCSMYQQKYHHHAHHDPHNLDLHNLADYSAAAAAAAYSSSMVAKGLESGVQESSKDLYWF